MELDRGEIVALVLIYSVRIFIHNSQCNKYTKKAPSLLKGLSFLLAQVVLIHYRLVLLSSSAFCAIFLARQLLCLALR